MPRNSDYLSAASFAAFGLVVAVASWRLDRLENLSINPWSAPGLLPGLVGVLMVILAAVLAVRTGRQEIGRQLPSSSADSAVPAPSGASAPAPQAPAGEPLTGGQGRTLIAGALCVLFAGVSLGHGLPFIAQGAAFIFLFVTVFSWPEWRAKGRIVRGLATAVLIGLAASGAISWLFESVFLVRLP